jgi:hypothetical protein
MSKAEANVLIEWGRIWNAQMWVGADEDKRDALIQHVNAQLNAVGFKLGRGWQNYDPVIRRAGSRPSSYAQIAAWASLQPNGGRQVAQLFLDWATDDKTGLQNLPVELQDLAIITHLAEVARGYRAALKDELYPLLEAIAAGTKTWGDYRDYSPSLKAAEDKASEWQE